MTDRLRNRSDVIMASTKPEYFANICLQAYEMLGESNPKFASRLSHGLLRMDMTLAQFAMIEDITLNRTSSGIGTATTQAFEEHLLNLLAGTPK